MARFLLLFSILLVIALTGRCADKTFPSWSAFIQNQETDTGDLAVKKKAGSLLVLTRAQPRTLVGNASDTYTFYCSNRKPGDDSAGVYLYVTILLLYKSDNPILEADQPKWMPFLHRNKGWSLDGRGAQSSEPAEGWATEDTLEKFIADNQLPQVVDHPLIVQERGTERETPWHAFPLGSQKSSASDINAYIYTSFINPSRIIEKMGLPADAIFRMENLLLAFKESSAPTSSGALKFTFGRKGADAVCIRVSSRAGGEYQGVYYLNFQ